MNGPDFAALELLVSAHEHYGEKQLDSPTGRTRETRPEIQQMPRRDYFTPGTWVRFGSPSPSGNAPTGTIGLVSASKYSDEAPVVLLAELTVTNGTNEYAIGADLQQVGRPVKYQDHFKQLEDTARDRDALTRTQRFTVRR